MTTRTNMNMDLRKYEARKNTLHEISDNIHPYR